MFSIEVGEGGRRRKTERRTSNARLCKTEDRKNQGKKKNIRQRRLRGGFQKIVSKQRKRGLRTTKKKKTLKQTILDEAKGARLKKEWSQPQHAGNTTEKNKGSSHKRRIIRGGGLSLSATLNPPLRRRRHA